MAKALIVDADEKTRVPFLRGILTRSLRGAGLPFEVAYAFASDMRQELEGIEEITSLELRNRVVKKLTGQVGHKIIERYQFQDTTPPVINLEGLDGQIFSYSDQKFKRELEVIGLSQSEIRIAVKKMHDHLQHSGHKQIHINHLGYLTYRCLHQDKSFGPRIADRYLTWVNFTRSGNPLIVLIGGTAGCGKSSISSALASRLDIVRTQSTDMLREVMRMMVPKRLLPVLHESSFNAGQTLPAEHFSNSDDPDQMLIAGYRTQAELLSVPCEAVIQRTLKEKVSLLLEGVHIAAPLLKKIPKDNAVVVHIMLAVLKQKDLKKRIKGRNLKVPERKSAGFPDSFEDIWKLQTYLLDEADQEDVAIVDNLEKEETMREIMKIVMNQIAKKYSITPKKLFGDEYLVSQKSE